MLLISTEEKLKERIKELTCLYDLTTVILKDSGSAGDILSEICAILKEAYHFSGAAVVEMKLQSHHIFIGALPEATAFQHSDIIVAGSKEGYIRVHYPAPHYSREHFLTDEQKLLDKVAVETGNFYEKRLSMEKEDLLKRGMERADRLSILGEITAGIAHELNTPLGNILGFAELIREQNKDNQTSKDISKIINAAIHSREIVKKLMFFSCEMPQHLEFAEVVPIISEALSLLGPSFKRKNISYTFTFDDAAVRAQLDNIQFTQVLFNILINSIYASPVSGTIRITLHHDDVAFYIEIADEGPGIPDAVKPKVFEPFFTTKPVGEGTGLGLSVVHGIIRSHKGEITALDNEPTGAVFRIKIPLNQ